MNTQQPECTSWSPIHNLNPDFHGEPSQRLYDLTFRICMNEFDSICRALWLTWKDARKFSNQHITTTDIQTAHGVIRVGHYDGKTQNRQLYFIVTEKGDISVGRVHQNCVQFITKKLRDILHGEQLPEYDEIHWSNLGKLQVIASPQGEGESYEIHPPTTSTQ